MNNNKVALIILLVLFPSLALSADYKLTVQPVFTPEKMREIYKPLTDYLSEQTGHNITLKTFRGFKSYWFNMKRRKDFDMALDGPHFTDYRIKNNNYKVLARQPDTVSFSVVTRDDLLLFDIEDLGEYRVSTMEAPSIGGLWMKEAFLNSSNAPEIVNALNSDGVVKNVFSGKADAAVIPTPVVGNYDNLNVLATSDPVPHFAFSVSPDVPDELAKALKKALLDAGRTKKGLNMLAAINLAPFISAMADRYKGYAQRLDIMKQ